MLHLLKTAGAQAVRGRARTPVRRAQGLAFAPKRGFCLPGIVAVAMIPLGSPAMSATYTVFWRRDRRVQRYQPSGRCAGVVQSAGWRQHGRRGWLYGHNFQSRWGSASVSANMFIGDFTQFSSQFGLQGGGQAIVEYTIRIVGPATNAFIPVHVRMVASVGGLQIVNGGASIPADVPIAGGATANVALSCANDTLNLPTLPGVVAETNYDYRFFFQSGFPAPQVEPETDSFDGTVMMAFAEAVLGRLTESNRLAIESGRLVGPAQLPAQARSNLASNPAQTDSPRNATRSLS
jgi:hypothetical protein